MSDAMASMPEELLENAKNLRWQVGGNIHETLVEGIYTDAARIADRAVTRPGERPKFDLDRTIDRVVTSRRWGFPLMILLFTVVFWITITGANYPSQWYALRRFRIPAAGGLQSGQSLQEIRCSRQTSVEHDDGIWMQRGWCDRHTDHRQPSRALDRHHHQ